ncbi:hypothetical protein V1514DRAFT_202121 [Lipomyces japonicus]|uniref:uncharacterized protein n=1 Tax=Lipomyces japonicus TaxID=56871 RepID=UPI0034CFFFE5
MVSIVQSSVVPAFYSADPATPTDYLFPHPHAMPLMPLALPSSHIPTVAATSSYPVLMPQVPSASKYTSKQSYISWVNNNNNPYPKHDANISAGSQAYHWLPKDVWSHSRHPAGSTKTAFDYDYDMELHGHRQHLHRLNLNNQSLCHLNHNHHGGVHQPARQQAYVPSQSSDPKAGGVSVKLDYDLDKMAEFLSVMASAVMGYKTPPTPTYKKFTLQILSSTRLPGSTIILSLVYLSRRCNLHKPSTCDFTAQYQLLIVSLILANKFNDDNTFTNKSWSDVTGLPIAEITRVESAWLLLINWKLNLCEDEKNEWIKWNDEWVKWSCGRDVSDFSGWYDQPQQEDCVYGQYMTAEYLPQNNDATLSSTLHQQYRYGENLHHLQQQYQQQQPVFYSQLPPAMVQLPPPHDYQLVHHNSEQSMSYTSHCNCNYCVFEPVVPFWSGPSAAVC